MARVAAVAVALSASVVAGAAVDRAPAPRAAKTITVSTWMAHALSEYDRLNDTPLDGGPARPLGVLNTASRRDLPAMDLLGHREAAGHPVPMADLVPTTVVVPSPCVALNPLRCGRKQAVAFRVDPFVGLTGSRLASIGLEYQ